MLHISHVSVQRGLGALPWGISLLIALESSSVALLNTIGVMRLPQEGISNIPRISGAGIDPYEVACPTNCDLGLAAPTDISIGHEIVLSNHTAVLGIVVRWCTARVHVNQPGKLDQTQSMQYDAASGTVLLIC